MKIFNFDKIFFRINVIAVLIVFILLAPTTHIVASWYPGKRDILWLLPLAVLIGSIVLWLLTALSMPRLIKWGIFEDRRKKPRNETVHQMRRVFRITMPMIMMAVQVGVLIGMCMCLIAFMRGDTLAQYLTYLDVNR